MSETSLVRLAEATGPTRRNVAIKFMQREDQFRLEISSRRGVDPDYVMPVLASCDSLPSFADEARALGHGPFGIIMEAADRNLQTIMHQESLRTRDTRMIVRQISEALAHLHSRGRIHGDVKPLNIVRTAARRYKLIDLDASKRIGVDKAGGKSSSSYSAPELVRPTFATVESGQAVYAKFWSAVDAVMPARHHLLATCPSERAHSIDFPLADESMDVWSLGVVLFELLVQENLFSRCFRNDNISNRRDERKLCMWECAGTSLLDKIPQDPGRHARHLVSWCLQGDPRLRPTMEEILRHPFIRDSTSVARASSAAGTGACVDFDPSLDPARVPIGSQVLACPKHETGNWYEATVVRSPASPRRAKQYALRYRNCNQPQATHVGRDAMRTNSQRARLRRTHAFISHYQKEGNGEAVRVAQALQNLGGSVWLDMYEDDLTLEGMREGVQNANVFILILTSQALERWYCQQEIIKALNLGKPIFILYEQDRRFAPFDFASWKNNLCWDKKQMKWAPEHAGEAMWEIISLENGKPLYVNKTTRVARHEPPVDLLLGPWRRMIVDGRELWVNLNTNTTQWEKPPFGQYDRLGRPDPSKDAPHPQWKERIRQEIERQQAAGLLMPLRRRDFEVDGMMQELVRRAREDHGCLWLIPPMQPVPATPGWAVHVVSHPAAFGSRIKQELECTLRDYGLCPVDRASLAQRAIIVLTSGAMRDVPTRNNIKAITNGGRHQFAIVYLENHRCGVKECGGWDFAAAEAKIDPDIERVLAENEAIAYRSSQNRSLLYEHQAMIRQLIVRLEAL